ncbi:MAG: hypothetical protein GY950_12610 [bacterium]|nr:hypothetical protein [bacterium]
MLPRNELARLPKFIKNNPSFVKSYNGLDRVLEYVFHPVVQNHYFISKKLKREQSVDTGEVPGCEVPFQPVDSLVTA